MKGLLPCLCALALLAGCASPPPARDDDGQPFIDGPRGNRSAGGGRSIWSDVLHTAMQTGMQAGMGMLHH
ncbi:hypothetical protein AA13595_0908 [Gluconacetobacter johannae DSM 13595]|uniref:Lipoprotein n=1 Tax=Gluconacetobacter johannae TaxID=112140 RepID=A0A7W4J966_9PROT|nr:hypothetical protein [Gluconacetobacter johannae]MBB2177005.1 hypothetical protein [Gluconacetobacter johannae]GBQ82367.1 hypothetical protein AA13595_0908 [Gluconacetobacter johannae DSM 13595]